MIAPHAVVIVGLLAASPALAESLNADAARRFVMGKLFAFNCFDGSRGAGRIYRDGSVIGTIQSTARDRFTPHRCQRERSKGEAVCASLDRAPIEPCFNLNKVDDQSFRGSISGLDFSYCDFTRRAKVIGTSPRSRRSRCRSKPRR